ncbi:MAG: Rpn family recombination-promoting nuclease/putative transposase [Synechococcales cyanobacterium]
MGWMPMLGTDQEQKAELGKGLLQTAETEAEFERRLSLIETILANKFPDLTTEIIMQLLDLKQTDITQSRFYQEIKQEGHQEGRQEGHQEGRQEGEATLVIRQLIRRLGALSDSQVAQIRQLSVPQLESLGEALLDFTVMTDLDNFLLKLV